MLTSPAKSDDYREKEINLYQKVQGKRDYDEYLAWKRVRREEERYERRDRRPVMGNCTSREFEAYGKSAWRVLGSGWAESEARKAWERVVRSKMPEEYADADYAVPRPEKSINCWKVGNDRRCKMVARACRPG